MGPIIFKNVRRNFRQATIFTNLTDFWKFFSPRVHEINFIKKNYKYNYKLKKIIRYSVFEFVPRILKKKVRPDVPEKITYPLTQGELKYFLWSKFSSKIMV